MPSSFFCPTVKRINWLNIILFRRFRVGRKCLPSVFTPLSDTERPGLPLDELGVFEEAVEDLPDENDGHEEKVDSRHEGDLGLQVLHQLLLLGHSLEILLQMPLIERSPGSLEIKVVENIFSGN